MAKVATVEWQHDDGKPRVGFKSVVNTPFFLNVPIIYDVAVRWSYTARVDAMPESKAMASAC